MELINVPSLPLHKPQEVHGAGHGAFMQGGFHAGSTHVGGTGHVVAAAASPMFPSCMLGLNHGGGNGNHVEHQNIIKNNSNNSSSSNSNACINPMPAAQGPMSVLDAAFAAAGPPPPLVSSPRDDQMVPCASYNTPWGTSLTVSDHMDMGVNAYLMPHQQPQPPAATVRTSTGQQQPPPRIEHHASNTKSPDIVIRSESPESTTTTTTRSQQQQQQVMQMAPMMHAPRIQAPPPPPPRVYGTFDATLVRDVVNNTARPKFDLVLNREAVLREWRKRCATAAGKTGKGQDGEFDVAVFGGSDTKSNSSDCSVCTAEFGVGQTVHMMPSTRTTANTATQQQQGGDAPLLSEPTRQERIERYRQKRLRRAFSKKVRYVIRKANAERRPRFKGRFINPNTLTVGDGD